MAVYTDIGDEELSALLAGYDLGEAVSFKGVAEGIENSNFLLETTAGRYFLTVYEQRVRPEELPYFLGLMTWLAEAGFPCARPIADRAGKVLQSVKGKPAAIVEFLPGLSPRRPSVAQCREAGRGLAWLHQAAAGYPGRRDNDLGQASWAGLFAPLGEAAEGLKPGLSKTIASDLERLAAGWPTGLPSGTTHADFFPDNVFLRDGRFAAAIDFYFACDDLLAYDLAVTLNAWCFEPGGEFNLTAGKAMIAGYEAVRPLTDDERVALPVLAHGAAMRFFLTRLQAWGRTPEGALVKPKDPMEYERKLAVHRAGLSILADRP